MKGNASIGSDASQVAGVVDKVNAELMKEPAGGLVGHSTGSGGTRGTVGRPNPTRPCGEEEPR